MEFELNISRRFLLNLNKLAKSWLELMHYILVVAAFKYFATQSGAEYLRVLSTITMVVLGVYLLSHIPRLHLKAAPSPEIAAEKGLVLIYLAAAFILYVGITQFVSEAIQGIVNDLAKLQKSH